MIRLREYQKRMIEEIKHSLYQGKSPFVVSPTGSGKMIIIAALANEIKQDILIVEHRKELIDQAIEKLELAGEKPGIIAASKQDPNPRSRIKVCMIQTIHRRGVGDSVYGGFNPSVIIIDEAHLAAAKSYRHIIDMFPRACRVCFSATPSRLDGDGFTDINDRMILGPSISQLTAGGFLVPINHISFDVADFSGCRISNLTKDYREDDVAGVLDNSSVTSQIVEAWNKFANNRITVVFAANIEHSKNLCIEFRRKGIKAEHIDGSTDDKIRREVIRRIRNGETQVLCNCGIVVEGFDAPIVSCVIIATATKSISKYLQCVGRGMRPHAESYKRDLVILDFGACEENHGRPDITRVWTLEGKVKRPKGRPRDDDWEDYEVKSGRASNEVKDNQIYVDHIARDSVRDQHEAETSRNEARRLESTNKLRLIDTARLVDKSAEIIGYEQGVVDYQLTQRQEENIKRFRLTKQVIPGESAPYVVPDRWAIRQLPPRFLPHGWEPYWQSLEDYRISNGFTPNYSEKHLRAEMRIRGYRV
jgi:superfamily II DNA or RNA helicase